MGRRFVFRAGDRNIGELSKGALEKMEYSIDWTQAGSTPGDTIASVASVSLDSTGASADTVLLSSTTNSGFVTTVQTKTGGTSGTGAATNAARFRIVTTATFTGGATPSFSTFIIIRTGGTYGPV